MNDLTTAALVNRYGPPPSTDQSDQAPASQGPCLMQRLRGHLAQLPSHAKARSTGALLLEATQEIERLHGVITQTLEEHRHLADGDDCTLSRLKLAVAENEAEPVGGGDGNPPAGLKCLDTLAWEIGRDDARQGIPPVRCENFRPDKKEMYLSGYRKELLNHSETIFERHIEVRQLLKSLHEWFIEKAPQHYNGCGLWMDVDSVLREPWGQESP